MSQYPTKQERELINAFSQLKNIKEVATFLRDLTTLAEIEEFSRRFQIAKLLWTTKKSYKEIAKATTTSTTTVTRVAQWLFKEKYQGYATILDRLYGPSQR